MGAALADFLRYDRWATLALIDGCSGLTDEQLDAHAPGASGSVREVFVHVVGGMQTSALRTKGRQHEGELHRESTWPGFAALREIAARTGDELVAIAESLDDQAEVDLRYRGKTYRYPTRQFLVHAVEHGVEHRTEIKVSLAQLGVATPDLDGWFFSAAMGYGKEVPS
ncbi:MAG TPA: DinB family protein [Candidatus Limnocylindria bacterium]|nr:DinB family protein [Candidatus Limnocylindria bacterium]